MENSLEDIRRLEEEFKSCRQPLNPCFSFQPWISVLHSESLSNIQKDPSVK